MFQSYEKNPNKHLHTYLYSVSMIDQTNMECGWTNRSDVKLQLKIQMLYHIHINIYCEMFKPNANTADPTRIHIFAVRTVFWINKRRKSFKQPHKLELFNYIQTHCNNPIKIFSIRCGIFIVELEWTYRTFIMSKHDWFVGTSLSSCWNSVYIATPTRRLNKLKKFRPKWYKSVRVGQ